MRSKRILIIMFSLIVIASMPLAACEGGKARIAAYLSFDNVEVGRQQALGVMTALGLPGSTTWTKENPAKVVQLAGSPTDNNATLFTKGQTEILQPYIDSGVIKIVAQQGVDNW